MGTQSTWGVQSELVMETKRLIFLLLAAIAGCFAAPGVLNQLDPNNMDHMALVELKKFVEGNLMKDVNETRIFTEKSAKTSGELASAIIKYANKFNSESAARLSQTLKNLTTSIDANLEAIVDNAKKNHKALEKQRDKKESGINTRVTGGFETLLDKVEKRLSDHEKLLSTNVAICAERRDSESAMGAKGKITYDGMFLTSVTIGGKAMNRTELKEVFKPSKLHRARGRGRPLRNLVHGDHRHATGQRRQPRAGKLPLRNRKSRRKDEDDRDKSDRQHRTERRRQGVCVKDHPARP